MDRGEAFKQEMRIIPASNGSFIVTLGEKVYAGLSGEHLGFTNVSDLLDWLVAHAKAFATNKIAADVTHELTEGEVVKAGRGPGLGAAIGDNPFASLVRPGIRRTSAAEKMFPYAGMSAADMQKLRTQDHFVADAEPNPAA